MDPSAQRLQEIEDWLKAEPSMKSVREVAALMVNTTPNVLRNAARWMDVDHRLVEQGVAASERLDLYRVSLQMGGRPSASRSVLLATAVQMQTSELEALVDSLSTTEHDPAGEGRLVHTALVALAGAVAIPPRFDHLLDLNRYSSWVEARQTMDALPPERRRPLLAALLEVPADAHPQSRWWRASRAMALSPYLDEGEKGALAALIDELRGETQASYASLVACFDRNEQVIPREVFRKDGFTDDVRRCVDLLEREHEDARRVVEFRATVRERAGTHILVDAPELKSVETWTGTTNERRTQIAQDVANAASAFGLSYVEMNNDSLPIAVFEHENRMRFSLVPGGVFTRGLSAIEEDFLRSRLASLSKGTLSEEIQIFLDDAPAMRPVSEVRVQPLLIAQAPTEVVKPAAAAELFVSLPFRLPTEREWEYASRGGIERELTWRGQVVPDDAWFNETLAGGSALANGFGLYDFGLYPEVCGDPYRPTYAEHDEAADLPVQEGPLVTRGGAAQVYPWQGCSEWVDLCNAARRPEDKTFMSLRFALGIRSS